MVEYLMKCHIWQKKVLLSNYRLASIEFQTWKPSDFGLKFCCGIFLLLAPKGQRNVKNATFLFYAMYKLYIAFKSLKKCPTFAQRRNSKLIEKVVSFQSSHINHDNLGMWKKHHLTFYTTLLYCILPHKFPKCYDGPILSFLLIADILWSLCHIW